jgi:hypothetical protein
MQEIARGKPITREIFFNFEAVMIPAAIKMIVYRVISITRSAQKRG